MCECNSSYEIPALNQKHFHPNYSVMCDVTSHLAMYVYAGHWTRGNALTLLHLNPLLEYKKVYPLLIQRPCAKISLPSLKHIFVGKMHTHATILFEYS